MTGADWKNLGLGVLCGLLLFAVGPFLAARSRPPEPVAQPSVPSLIPPKCDGPCCRCRPQSARTFSVVCPYCRNRLLATPPQTGEIGEVAKDKAASK